MSRSHMIYDDVPLQQEGIKSSRWKTKWNPKDLQNGKGILLEGVFHKKTRHVIQDTEGQRYRYCIFHIEVTRACQRRWDSEGKEIEANFGQTGIVKTGYLNSSYKTVTTVTPDTLTFDEICQKVKSELCELERAGHAHSLCFWGGDDNYSHVECEYGQAIRLKTAGDSVFIESLTKLDSDQRAHSSNYTGGEKAGQSWTDKVMNVKKEEVKQETTKGGSDEVDDDEWDD